MTASTLRIRRAAMAIATALAIALPAPALALIPPPPVSVPSSVLMTMDGTVLWARSPMARRRVASTIKMLNALVLRDRVANLDTTVTVPAVASRIRNGGVDLWTGERLTYRRLLTMMLVASANDAAEAIAVRVAGSEKAYVALMNAKAASLGLTGTRAADPHGLGKRETSTASDLTVLARRVMSDPVLRAVVQTRYVTVPRPKGRTKTYKSTDQLLGAYPGIEGVKTGFTNPAGYCFVGAAKRGGVELLGVVLGAKSNSARFTQMRRLLDWGFANTHLQTLVSTEVTMGVVAVQGAAPGSAVTVHANVSVARVMLDGSFDTTISLPPTVAAPVERGQRIGTVEVGRDGVALASVPLVADEAVAAAPSLPELLLTWLVR